VKKGQVFFVVGASGSGKDSILRAIREEAQREDRLIVAHRYITRAASDQSENHISLTEEEFVQRRKANCFVMHWHANRLHYGIGIELNTWINSGMNIVVNGSREYLPRALELFPELITINIEVPSHLLKERLIKRGRESLEELEARFSRSASLVDVFPENTQILDNSESVAIATKQFFDFLREK
jgi:ribose 1,5-bisphosphokinase